jgi:IstB-like ATP binding protein
VVTQLLYPAVEQDRHLLNGLGNAAAEAGYRGRHSLASKFVNELAEAADDKQLSRTIGRYGRVDLLCLDELGYMELDRRGAELLFQVLTDREERSAIAIASKEPFSGWTKIFTDPRLCAASVDRLTFAGQIIETRHHQLPARARPPGPRQGKLTTPPGSFARNTLLGSLSRTLHEILGIVFILPAHPQPVLKTRSDLIGRQHIAARPAMTDEAWRLRLCRHVQPVKILKPRTSHQVLRTAIRGFAFNPRY